MLILKIISTIIIPLVMLISCSNELTEEENKEKKSDIEELIVKPNESVKNIISTTCVVQPLKVYSVKSRASGEINNIYVSKGSKVNKNDVIASLDIEYTQREKQKELLVRDSLILDKQKIELDLKQAKVKFNALEKLEQMQKSNQNRKPLVLSNSPEGIQKDKTIITLKQIELKLLESELRLKDIEEKLSYAYIRAPNDGIILEQKIEIGNIISSGISGFSGGDVLFELFESDKLKLECNIREIDAPLLSVGQTMQVKFKIAPERTFESNVSIIAPKLEKNGGITSLPFSSELKDITGIELKPGMHADVTVNGKAEHSGLILETNSLGVTDSGIYVYVRSGEEYTKKMIVAKRIGANRYLVTDGVKIGDVIAKYYVIADHKYSEN